MDKRDMEDIHRYALDEWFVFAVGHFLLSGAFWLAFERIADGEFDAEFLLVCILFITAGGALTLYGWRKISRGSARIKAILDEVEEEEDVD